jgi:hypothetical protein
LAGHAARKGEKLNVYIFLVAKSEERDHSEDLGVDGSFI